MLCVPGQLYFIPRLILQNTNGEEMQVDILAFWALPYFYAALSRGDLSYVAGEFRIFGAIFLEDGWFPRLNIQEPGSSGFNRCIRSALPWPKRIESDL
jgi:hypothetical protein